MSKTLYIVRGKYAGMSRFVQAGVVDTQVDLTGKNGDYSDAGVMRKLQGLLRTGSSVAALLGLDPDEQLVSRLKFLAELENAEIVVIIPIPGKE